MNKAISIDEGLPRERRRVGELTPDPENARIHPERNIEAIAASLRRFGQQKPVVVTESGVVVAGNGTLEAARRLGWEHLEVVVTKLAPAEARAFAIADNRTAELAEWDFDALARSLPSEDGIGFSGDEVAIILGLTDGELADVADPGPLPIPPSDEGRIIVTLAAPEDADEARALIASALADGGIAAEVE